MYIKSDLIYDKYESTLIGFVNVGDINNHLLEFQATINSGETTPSLASMMMVFMVKGMLPKFDYPYDVILPFDYPILTCHNVSGNLMFDPAWAAVARLAVSLFWHCAVMELLPTEDYGSYTATAKSLCIMFLMCMPVMRKSFCISFLTLHTSSRPYGTVGMTKGEGYA